MASDVLILEELIEIVSPPEIITDMQIILRCLATLAHTFKEPLIME